MFIKWLVWEYFNLFIGNDVMELIIGLGFESSILKPQCTSHSFFLQSDQVYCHFLLLALFKAQSDSQDSRPVHHGR